jgi:hypothetical protein
MFSMRKITRAIVATAVATATLMIVPTTLSAAVAAPEPVYVPASDIGTERASGDVPKWFVDASNGGSFATTSDSFDKISRVLKLTTPGSGDAVRVLESYDSSSPDISTLVSGASYTYAGSNANFQIEIFFTPEDLDQYGPSGTKIRCTQAKDGSEVIENQCYTVLKWEPFLTPSGMWKTVDLTADTAANSSTSTGGWKNTNAVGIYPKPGVQIGNTLSEYLAQMTSYTVLGAGIALGSGTTDGTSWIKNLTFGGTEYRFGSAPLDVALSAETPTVEVTDSTRPLVVEVGSGTKGAGVSYKGLLTDGAGTIPQTTITTSGGVTVQIPQTLITATDKTWDGVIKAPTVVSNSSVTIPAESGTTVTIATAIEVGAGTIGLTFDNAVRLLLPGQSDKLVGFERNGTFTPITTKCSADSQTAGDALAAGGDCYLSVGADIVIWTKHFTTFVAYSSVAALAATGAGAPSPALWAGGALVLVLGSALLVARGRGGTRAR